MLQETFFQRVERLIEPTSEVDFESGLKRAGLTTGEWRRMKRNRIYPGDPIALRVALAFDIRLDVLADGLDPRDKETLERFMRFLELIEPNRDVAAEIFRRGAPMLISASYRSERGIGGDQVFLDFLKHSGLDALLSNPDYPTTLN